MDTARICQTDGCRRPAVAGLPFCGAHRPFDRLEVIAHECPEIRCPHCAEPMEIIALFGGGLVTPVATCYECAKPAKQGHTAPLAHYPTPAALIAALKSALESPAASPLTPRQRQRQNHKEIYARRLAGEKTPALAAAYNLTERHIKRIIANAKSTPGVAQ